MTTHPRPDHRRPLRLRQGHHQPRSWPSAWAGITSIRAPCTGRSAWPQAGPTSTWPTRGPGPLHLRHRDRLPRTSAGELRVIVNGQDATDELRTETAGAAASAIAAIPEVRAALKDRQRAFRRPPGLVADGRDMGTVIFPDAAYKVFLTASAEERAERRYKQLKDKGVSVTLDGLLREILARDARDAQRAVAPLRPAEDAVRIDTTGLGIEEVVERVLALVPATLSAFPHAAGQSRRNATSRSRDGDQPSTLARFHRATQRVGRHVADLKSSTADDLQPVRPVCSTEYFSMTESFAELFEQSQTNLAKLKPGAIVIGTVVEVRSDVVVINAGLKSEGIVPIEQFRNDAGEIDVAVGDEVKVALDSLENGFGETVLSREKAKRAMVWDELEEALEKPTPPSPAASAARSRAASPSTSRTSAASCRVRWSTCARCATRSYLEGKELEFKLIKLDRKRNNVVVSRRAVVESEHSEEREQLLEKLQSKARC